MITPQARKHKRDDYRRWERALAMELWQMDIVGGVKIVDGSEAKIVSGVDDHSRFCVSAFVVERATARPTCDGLVLAMRRHGVPLEVLTDNGKVFTGRFGPGPGEVLFDRICRENGIKHILTRSRSPTTTGKIERWHKTMRVEFLNGKVFADVADAQAQLDVWVGHHNHVHPHQSLGMATPWDRFKLARNEPARPAIEPDADPAGLMPPSATRRVAAKGTISFASAQHKVGVWLAGQNVEVVCDGGLVQIHHRGVLIATHARRHDPTKQSAGMSRGVSGKEPQQRPTVSVVTVTRKVDSSGNVCFAGASYRAGTKVRRRQVRVAVVGEQLEISIGEQLIRRHTVKHDRTREHGALANPGGRHRALAEMDQDPLVGEGVAARSGTATSAAVDKAGLPRSVLRWRVARPL